MKKLLIPLFVLLLTVPAFATILFSVQIDCETCNDCTCNVEAGNPAQFDVVVANHDSEEIKLDEVKVFFGETEIFNDTGESISPNQEQKFHLNPLATSSGELRATVTVKKRNETSTKTAFGAITIKHKSTIPEIPALFALAIVFVALIIINKKMIEGT